MAQANPHDGWDDAFDNTNIFGEPLRDYEQGQRDEREKWSVLIKDRIRDLQSCTKHDDCMGKADILLVILDDYDYGVAREEKS